MMMMMMMMMMMVTFRTSTEVMFIHFVLQVWPHISLKL
jgi:hypothetical protein